MKFNEYLQKQKDRETARQKQVNGLQERLTKLTFPEVDNIDDMKGFLTEEGLDCHVDSNGTLIIFKRRCSGYEVIVRNGNFKLRCFNGFVGDYDDEVVCRLEYLFGGISPRDYARMRCRGFAYWFSMLDAIEVVAFFSGVVIFVMVIFAVIWKIFH